MKVLSLALDEFTLYPRAFTMFLDLMGLDQKYQVTVPNKAQGVQNQL